MATTGAPFLVGTGKEQAREPFTCAQIPSLARLQVKPVTPFAGNSRHMDPADPHLSACPDEMQTSPSLCFLQPGPQTASGQLGPLQLPGTEKCKGLNKNYMGYLRTICYHIPWPSTNNSLLLVFCQCQKKQNFKLEIS